VIDVIYWKDPRISGAILAAGLIFFYVTTWGGYSYLTLFSIITMMHLLVSILHGVVSTYQGSSPPSQKPFQLDVEASKKNTALVVEAINNFLKWYFDILSGKNLVLSLQIICLLCVTWTIGTWMDGSTLLLLAFLGGMSIPVAYQNNQSLVDAKLRLAKDKMDEMVEKINNRIPKAETTEGAKKGT